MISAGRLGHPSGPKVGGGGLPPQLLEPCRIGGGVADGVLDVAVAEVVLDQPGVRALVGQGVAAGVAQHVRVGGQGQPGPLAAPAHRQPRGLAAQGAAPLADEKGVRRGLHRLPRLQPRLDRPDFLRAQRLGRGQPFLQPQHMHHPILHVDLGQLQAARLRHPQAVAERQQQQAAVAGGVAAALGGREQPLHLRRHQIVAFEHRTVYCWHWGAPILSNS